ncbi:MAG: Nucleotidyl transferase [Candidatus Giovannonibacteria bacterium GW2011_GWA1_43_15]|uniref:Nucleotidyl transferase n=3 Tax=Parcubacteria group TaxID=1794811 RepID=A0A0G1L549_9BACT|nr:MAG: Nucleotidyl transferase [Candidatus Giovannonibacteria bacterium GW2011_GWB1_43_13]KKS99657.1 MAG: Nucleotidyl transferase [Candidatus Giovannonibacteria bacterium GW2011_GWA1_43_15]KKT21341.1 MAG: Nucleotidyl transferase [Candidatus Giovannonibacteria bacterium GW2011_GWC2_43_8]KKT63742.1 MAG: Nucleotidyl transferase [Candidatus Giovannonibacteria bacterium GW2011_GWA2_44_26]
MLYYCTNMSKVDTAVILAGGKGLRLRPETIDKPKAMVRVAGKPIIEWVILWLKKNGIKNIVLSVDYKKETLASHLGDGRGFGVKIIYNHHKGAKDTGDAFRSVFKNINLPETFIAMNGDQITNLSIKKLVAHHEKYRPIATVAVCPMKSPFGIVHLDENHTIRAFHEKPILYDKLMNTGIYIFERGIHHYLPKHGAIEKTTFKKLVREKQLNAYAHRGFFSTVNDHKDLASTEEILKRAKLNFI